MPDNIVGYIDRSVVKGQTYRYAGCPVPSVFTGDIDTISEDLLVKAMFVINDGSSYGTFPMTVGGQYLMNTVKYGDDHYIQTAYEITNNVEYIRVYSNNAWTKWITSNVGDVEGRVEQLETTMNSVYNTSVTPNTGHLVTLTSDVRKLDSRDASNKGRVTILEDSVSNINTTLTGKIDNKIKQVTLTQNITLGTAGAENGYFQLATELTYPTNGILIGMRVDTSYIAAIRGTIYMLCHAENGTKPWINYQKGEGVTFSAKEHSFIFTFYTP